MFRRWTEKESYFGMHIKKIKKAGMFK